MSSIIFDPSMLTASPSPSPKPEEHPQDGGDASNNDTTLDDLTPKEPEESEADRVQRAWMALLEEQESWLHDWNAVMADMNSVFKWACAANVHVSLKNADVVDLDKGKATVKLLTKAVKVWKQRAKESALTTHQAHVEKEAGTSRAAEKGKGKATNGLYSVESVKCMFNAMRML
ncbi:hypothetical protein C8R48DRAFT_768826 [Suillus tomentosus]|nr:hypothetical protein C8R48DRAFT_768826 [Suillus tomentosus]